MEPLVQLSSSSSPKHYAAYRPRPFTRADRETTTVLFGGLTWKHERLVQGVLHNLGYHAEPLPNITREDLDAGKEQIDVGACCPTIFTTGSLVSFLKRETAARGRDEVARKYLFLTAGACGPCRFGQYQESYAMALDGLGLRDFRILLMAQDQMDQSGGAEAGLDVNLPFALGLVYALLSADCLVDLEYQIRPYEVIAGQTETILKESVEALHDAFRRRPDQGRRWRSLAWHLSTGYFTRALRHARRRWDAIEVDRLRVKPRVKITGEFWLQTHEGDGNYNIKRWLEQEGAEVVPPPVAVWLDYLMHPAIRKLEHRHDVVKHPRLQALAVESISRLYHRTYDRLRRAAGGLPHALPDQEELRRLAEPFFHFELRGGEGHMLIGKALHAHHHKLAHMICELSPYGCMPNTMSIGSMANVAGKYPDLLYAPIEVKGDAEVHALSRCQMILTEAKKRAQAEFDEALRATGLTPERIREWEALHPEARRATYRVPHRGCCGAAANYVRHLAETVGSARRAGRTGRTGRAGPPGRRGSLMAAEALVRLEARARPPRPTPAAPVAAGPGKICGIDVGSTTCKYVLASPGGEVIARAYERHNTRQAEKILEFLDRLEAEHGLRPEADRLFFTGSGSGLIAPLAGGKVIQEVVAVAAAVERLHPSVHFVSEIGGEDMKTIFFTGEGEAKSKQVLMQSACSGGTGTFIEKTARKLEIPVEQLSKMHYLGHSLHKISSKCGIFAEADANTLLKAGVSVDEIIASLFEAVVYQNLATLTRGNTPLPEILLLGGPNLFFQGLQEAWRHHLAQVWKERSVALPPGTEPEQLIRVPDDALYYAALGCVEVGMREPRSTGLYQGTKRLRWWIEEGQHEEKKKLGRGGLWSDPGELEEFRARYGRSGGSARSPAAPGSGTTTERGRATAAGPGGLGPVVVGCDFGSTTAKAVCLSPEKELLFSCYALSKGNPIEDAKALFRQVREAMGSGELLGLAITGYGKDLLQGILGADCPVVETVAHATAGLHFFPDADCICDVGGVDVKIMILNNGAVTDFRLNSQCSSGNGAFLQGVAERFAIPMSEMADGAFRARAMPQLSMGCGVFLQSDIVNQQRKGWQAEEILAGLCAILPLNVWIYAGGLNNLKQVGRKYILQGGTHRNLAVVKTQVDFILGKVPDAEVVVHPYSGEAGAIGAALVALDWWQRGGASRFRGFDAIEKLTYRTATSVETVCSWCPVSCQRSFIDVQLPGAKGRPWSKVPLPEGWERVIVNNSCPKGLVEDLNEMKAIKAGIEKTKHAFPNVADLVRKEAFRRG